MFSIFWWLLMLTPRVCVIWPIWLLTGCPARLVKDDEDNRVYVIVRNYTTEWLLIYLWFPFFWGWYFQPFLQAIWTKYLSYIPGSGSLYDFIAERLSLTSSWLSTHLLQIPLATEAVSLFKAVIPTGDVVATLGATLIVFRLITKPVLMKHWNGYVTMVFGTIILMGVFSGGYLSNHLSQFSNAWRENKELVTVWVLFSWWTWGCLVAILCRTYRYDPQTGELCWLSWAPWKLGRRVRFKSPGKRGREMDIDHEIRNPIRFLFFFGAMDIIAVRGKPRERNFDELEYAVGLWFAMTLYGLMKPAAVRDQVQVTSANGSVKRKSWFSWLPWQKKIDTPAPQAPTPSEEPPSILPMSTKKAEGG